MTSNIDNKDITFVVQGPVTNTVDLSKSGGKDNLRVIGEGLPEKSIRLIREIFPGAKVIISTWKGQPADGLDADLVIYSNDPGPTILGQRKSQANYENINRQIVSTLEGLKKVSTKYAVKMRSDNVLYGREFLKFFDSYPNRQVEYSIFRERIVASNIHAVDNVKGWPIPFHPSDFFHFGLTEDLLKLWDVPLLENYVLDKRLNLRTVHSSYPWPQLCVEQILWLACLNKYKSVALKHKMDLSNGNQETSNLFMVNNLVILDREEIALEVPDRIDRCKFNAPEFFTHTHWQALYKRYCDFSFDVDGLREFSAERKKQLMFDKLKYGYKHLFGFYIRCNLIRIALRIKLLFSLRK